MKKYLANGKPLDEQIEILKQEILALKNKIERYTTRCEFYRQNKLFETNQKRFYDNLISKPNDKPNENISPSKSKVLLFWSKIWGNNKKHNLNADWIKEIEKETEDIPKQDDLLITSEMVQKALKKMKNWKAAGKDVCKDFGWKMSQVYMHD